MALFSATFGALASWLTIGAAAAVVGTSTAASAGAFTSKPKEAEMPQIPATAKETASETIAKAQEQAQAITRQRQVAARRSRSVFSSPLGLAGEATTIKKTLLGQ